MSYFLQEKSDSSDGGKESSSEAGPDGQDGSSSSSSKTKESSAGYEEKVVSTLQATLNCYSDESNGKSYFILIELTLN